MLKLAWYLSTEFDYWAGLSEAPRLPQAVDLAATLSELFDRTGCSPAHTATAVETMLRMAEHLSDAIPLGRIAVADAEQFARLVLGCNLLIAYLAQISARLAYHADTGTGADLSTLTAPDRAALTQALAMLSCRLEESAALCKEAHLVAGATRDRARR